jgi:hypothetical protein
MTAPLRRAGLAAFTLVLLLAACANPERSFDKAKAGDTREAYAGFVERYPDHPLAAEAKARVDDLDWGAAETAGTVEAFEGYLGQHPDAAHAKEASARLEQLRWQAAVATGTVVACRDFFRLHPAPTLAAPAVELAPGLAVSDVRARSYPAYRGHGLPDESAFEHWVTGGTLSMSVESFGPDKLPTAGRFVDVAVWFSNRGDEEREVWFSEAEGSRFVAPLVVADADPLPLAGLVFPGASIADASLVTTLEGKLGIRLAKGERTWVVLLYDVPGPTTAGAVLLGRTPLLVSLPAASRG